MPLPDLRPLTNLLTGRTITVLAGAGMSTESGIPDYGGLASRKRRTRIQYGDFVGQSAARQRYWARAAIGWRRVHAAEPNDGHRAVARLEAAECVVGVITQNVDGLHHRAGSRRVVELHGSLSRVVCLGCGSVVTRADVQQRLERLNPWIAASEAPHEPDGDAELADERVARFIVPECDACGGILKPDVVFFGERVPKVVTDAAWQLYEEGEVLLVVGSSLAVFSGYRFVLQASKDDRPVAVLNLGPTRGDDRATVKVEGRAGAVLASIAKQLAEAG
jgi:NAD-dependent SIR2 family protein deacetylase